MGIALAVIASNATIDSGPLTSAFATYGTEINRVGAFLPAGAAGAAATNAATASALVLRDGSGGAQFAGTLSAAILAASGNASVQGTTLLVGAATLQAALLVQGAATLQSTLAVTGAITATGGVVGNASTASGLLAPVGFNALSAEYRPFVNAAADTITLGAGPFYPDSSGNIVPGATAQNVSLANALSAAQPTGTNSQYVLVTLPPGSTTPVVTGGAVSAGTPTPPVNPSLANWPIALVLRRGATTLPSGIVAAADINDLRGKGWGSGGSGGGSGNDAGVRAAPVWTEGADLAIFPNGHDSTNVSGAETGWFNANLAKTDAAGGTLQALTADFVPLAAATRIYKSSATSLTLPAGATFGAGNSSPFPFAVAGRWTTLVADLSNASPVSGAAGIRYIMLDASVVGTPALRIRTTNTVTTYQVIVGTILWDGSTLIDGSQTWGQLFNMTSPQLALSQVRADAASSVAQAGAVAGAAISNVQPSPTPTLTNVYLPVGGRVRVRNLVSWQITTAPAAGEYFFADVLYRTSAFGGAGAGTWTAPTNATDGRVYFENSRVEWGKNTEELDIILPSGVYDFVQAISFSGAGASTAAVNLATPRSLIATVYAG